MQDLETLWLAMKSSHYQRTVESLASKIYASSDAMGALQASLDTVVRTVHAQAGTLWFYDRFGDNLIHPSAFYGGSDIHDVALEPGEGIVGQVIESRRPVITDDCKREEHWARRVDRQTGFQTISMICVPLISCGVAFGAIQLINKTDSLPYDSKDLAFSESLAQEISVLLRCKGLLEDYVRNLPDTPVRTDHPATIQELLDAKDTQHAAFLLRTVRSYAALPHSEQLKALQLCQELRELFAKNQRRMGDQED